MAKQTHFQRSVKLCPICSETVFVKNQISHINTHFGVQDFQCQFCDKVFSKRTSLKDHEQIHSRKTLSDESQENHDITMDSGSNKLPFKCNYCPKTFQLLSSVTNHMSTHSRKQPYACPFCSKEFKKPLNMWTHLETVHSKSNNNSVPINEMMNDVKNSLKKPSGTRIKEKIKLQSNIRIPESLKNVNLWPKVVLSRALSDAISKCGC